ncbi:GFA family protein [Streptomyces sp. NPDC019645]|uniref:GFA family protein n=1 Tax=Streptomyces sp. NPDC019645 TaxID=3154786 RepID=UPI0033DA8E20
MPSRTASNGHRAEDRDVWVYRARSGDPGVQGRAGPSPSPNDPAGSPPPEHTTSRPSARTQRLDRELCSCRHETRISGGPAVLWVGFRKDGLKWTGPGGAPTWYSTWPTLHRGFCPRCGTHLVAVADGSDMVTVTGFSLNDHRGIEPVGHSSREEAAPWMTITLSPN